MIVQEALRQVRSPQMSTGTGTGDVVPYPAQVVARYRAAGLWTQRSLAAQLTEAMRSHATAPALITVEGRWTAGELLDAAAAYAAGLAALTDLTVGEPVMFQLGNVHETVISYLGCLLAGLPPVCTLPQHGSREIGLLAEHTGARALLAQADFGEGRLLPIAETLRANGPIDTVVVARGAMAGGVSFAELLAAGAGAVAEDQPGQRVDPGAVAAFQLSGGTTGLPKVAPRLHEEYAYNSRAWARAMHYGPDDLLLYPLPLLHNAGISLALQPGLLAGTPLLLAPNADVNVLLDLIDSHRPTLLPLLPPALVIRLLAEPRAASADLSCIRALVVGGQRLPVEIAERLRDELGIAVRQMFGMAEGMFLLTPDGAGEDVRHHTVGAPICPEDEVRVLDPGTEDEVPDGEIGELACRGPYTIRGYYRAPGHNATTFTADGFYRTGDLARRHVHPDGVHYSIEGRLKDVINRGVEKIHTEEVEELIARHPAVRSVALVAMPDPVLGERPCAYLVVNPGEPSPTVSSLGEFLLAAGLAKYKLPERVELVEALPLTNIGKVDKKALRADVAGRIASDLEVQR